ncbi:hypothetical protein GCM10011609_76990 [Lentzea pudingi]|uniref:HIRAN domain-containing protein n=1 Tax=Lentzea pudingi TaxID=1789439 RepID=A0ABQ2ISR1_9PSEU|nr:hypothetical protein [Lentzea pudingi]GGN23873.1 hypothetical protein GCM10011609_76990 [Lentzea pudingi]
MAIWPNQIDTVGDLQDALEQYDRATPIRWAAQPGNPFEYTIGPVVRTPDDADGDGTEHHDPPVVWLGERDQVGYLPDLAANALGWSQ